MTGQRVTPKYTHVYYEYHACWDGCFTGTDHECYEMRACPVTRTTAKRIYFRGADNGPKWDQDREMYVDRAAIERDGSVYHRG
ncbi:MAG: hypothetical protein WCI78_17875, partial [Mycobacterium sp.]